MANAPVYLLLAAGPEAPGQAAVWAQAAATGRPLRILLTAEGLAWATPPHRAALPDDADLAVCSQQARDAGWRASDAPEGVRWSSVATWLAERDPAGPLWTVWP